MTPDTSGPTLRVPLAHYDPASSCWRTSGVMFPSDWPTSSQTCPAWGMTRRGELFELPTPALPTDAPASSSSLLPTPTTEPLTGNGHARHLGGEVKGLLPTPRTTDGNGAGAHGTGGPDLRTTISLLPPPAVNDMGAGKTVEAWDDWTARMQSKHGNGNGHGASLSIEALRLPPTPRASDGEKGCTNQRGSSGDLMLPSAVVQLLPTPSVADSTGGHLSRSGDRSTELLLPGVAKALTLGATTPPPSPDGPESSDDQLPGQLSLDATDHDSPPHSSNG